MNDDIFFLRPNVVIEPLFDRWYAWPHLISPATAAMNISGRHMKIMNSYIQAPQAHASAVKNPKMLGGPFMDFDGKRTDEVLKLRDKTQVEQQNLLNFAKAVKELDRLLKRKAKGYSLEPLYREVPEILKGFVELVYDTHNQPSFRFFEPLLYHSEFYKKSSQSIALWLTNNDQRPFVLSTPRLNDSHVIHLNTAFASKEIDDLARMKWEGGSLKHIMSRLCISEVEEDLFKTFFTTTPPKKYERYTGDYARMRYFGHACILIETKNTCILLDPLVSYYGYPQDVNRYSDMDLPEQIDFVLITHNHQDHILLETLLPLRHKIKNIVIPRSSNGAIQDPNLKLMFNSIGFHNVIEIGELDILNKDNTQITGIPFLGEHSDLNILSKLCYHVKVDGFSMLFAADSCNIEPMLYKHVQLIVGDVDVVFLGMECDGAPLTWLYGPLLTEDLPRDMDESRRLAGSNFDKGKELVNVFHPSEVYVYAMGQEPWLQFISSIKYTPESNPIIQSDKLIDYLRDGGVISERLFGEKEIVYNTKGL